MKITTLKSVAIAVGLAAPAFGQATSNVVGYETFTAPGNSSLLVGIRLHNTVDFSGVFTSSTGASLTDSAADFSSVDADALYLVEINDESSPVNGTIIEVFGSEFSGGEISSLSGITADFEASYVIRRAATVSDIFGGGDSGNALVLDPGTSTTGDTIFIPATGETISHSEDVDLGIPGVPPTPGVYQSTDASNTDPGNTPLPYLDAFFITNRGSDDLDVIIAGELKTGATVYPVIEENTFFSGVYPALTTLDNSGLADNADFTQGSSASGDLIFDPNTSEVFNRSADVDLGIPGVPPTPGEFVGSLGGDGSSEVPAAFIFQNRGAGGNLLYTPPSEFAGF